MSILAIDTTCFGSWDVVSLAKKLTILEFGFGLSFISTSFIDAFSSEQKPPYYWWFLGIKLVLLTYFCLEYYGIAEKKVGIINFCCYVRIFKTLGHGICLIIIIYNFFHLGLLPHGFTNE